MGARIRVGLIGSGIGPSLSPALHEAAGRRLGLDYRYALLDIEDLAIAPEAIGGLLDDAAARGWAGVNITHPCKQTVVPLLDELSADAAALGAVNTVVLRDGRAVGHNTDWSGFTRALQDWDADPALDDVLLLGAGGAGSAVGYALARLGAGRVRVADLDATRAAELCRHLAEATGRAAFQPLPMDEVPLVAGRVGGVVHVTPMGMAAHPGTAIDPAVIRAGAWVADVVYRPLETRLVMQARLRGNPVLTGGAMAVHQAADSFALFAGIAPDRAKMLADLRAMTAAETAGGAPD